MSRCYLQDSHVTKVFTNNAKGAES